MARVTSVLNKAKSAHDLGLLKVLQSEINHEFSFNPFQDGESGSLGDFAVDFDSPLHQDVILRRKSESGEEIAISALLGPERSEEKNKYPREVLMKVGIRKPSLKSILQIDCKTYSVGVNKSSFNIYGAHYIPSLACLDSSVYRSTSFSDLDPQLQDELKQYLLTMGISEHLTNFLLHHMHKKEQSQYVDWLQRLESFVLSSNE